MPSIKGASFGTPEDASKVGYMETRSLAYYDEATTRRLAVISTLRFRASMKMQKSVTAATEQRQIKTNLRWGERYRTGQCALKVLNYIRSIN
jgi:hypothetical protein